MTVMSTGSTAGQRAAPGRRRAAALGVMAGLALLGVGACRGEGVAATGKRLSTDDFVQIVVELREAGRVIDPDSARTFEARRREILDRHGASEEDLRAFVDRNHARTGFMVAVWDTIAERLRSPPPDPDLLPPSAGVRRHPDDVPDDVPIDELR